MKTPHPVLCSLIALIMAPILLNAFPGEVMKSYPLPSGFPMGIAFDGKYIWTSDRKTDLLYCIDPASGKVIRTLESPAYFPAALTWDGKYLWNADLKGGTDISEEINGMIYKLDPIKGTILKTLVAPSKSPVGLAWDGTYLWSVDNLSDELIQFSPDDGTTIRSFKSPSPEATGLAFDGKYLWVCDHSWDEIYKVDPENGQVILVTDAPGPYIQGVAFDGTNLWAVDYQEDLLYQLKANDSDRFVKLRERTGRLIYTDQLRNFGPGEVSSADIHIAIPVDRDNQQIIGEFKYNIMPTDIVTDQWGQKTAHFHLENIKAGKSVIIEMTTLAKTWEVRYFLDPDKVGHLTDIPEDVKRKYLADNEKYQINDPVIQDALKKAVGDEKNPFWIARKIYNYIIAHMYYEMSGGWNTAPTVLARGNGSCSEYTFVFISMCRAEGIPARYVGSVVVRGEDASMDDVFHRWAEIYLPGYGWVPIDPSRGDQDWPRSQAAAFGYVAGNLLITTQSGGGSETMGWTYNSNQFWTTDPKTYVNWNNFGDWEPAE
jgi:transglutaminase-like putative cysteine protease